MADDLKTVWVKLPVSMVKKLDRHVERERKERRSDVEPHAITRSSVIRSVVGKMLEQETTQ